MAKDTDIQELYDIFTAQCIKLLSDPGQQAAPQQGMAQGQQPQPVQTQGKPTGQSVIDNISNASDPKIIADAILGVITRVEDQGEQNGVKFPLEVVFKGGNDILTLLFESGRIQTGEGSIQEIVGLIVGKYLDQRVKSGKISPEQLKQIQQGGQNG